MEHSFNIDVAKEYGVVEAIIIRNFQYWILLNKANKKNFHDGHYWTYNSRAAMLEIFPYLSEQSLKTALSHIIKNGVLITGNYNENKYNRTNWYAFYDEEKWIGENQLTDWLKSTNQSVEINQPIPNNKPYTIQESKDISSLDKKETNDISLQKNVKKFVVPKLDEVKQYIAENNYKIDAEQFYDYYTSIGWKVGNKPMKDWKAAVRTWVRKDKEANPQKYVEPPKPKSKWQ